jgi:hypothetical protein
VRRRRGLILGAVLVLAAVAAFVLRDVIQRTIILPFAYFWWVLGLYYHAIPQSFFWFLLILVAFLTAMASLIPENPAYRTSRPEEKSAQGPVEALAIWMEKTHGGVYYKWLVAHRLGKVARELLAQREGGGSSRVFGPLKGQDWDPPDEVKAYLESGLNGSFADYPPPRWPWSPARPSPLDVKPQDVIAFLESEMESRLDRNR